MLVLSKFGSLHTKKEVQLFILTVNLFIDLSVITELTRFCDVLDLEAYLQEALVRGSSSQVTIDVCTVVTSNLVQCITLHLHACSKTRGQV